MRCSSILGLFLVTASALGQQAAPERPATPAPAPTPATTPTPTAPGQSSADVHSEARSRELFTACDGDGDDRLDLFEASDAFENLGDPRDPTGFRRLDTDRDGYVTWPEFDAWFRSVVRHGATFRVRTCRSLVQQAPELQRAQAPTPLQRFLQLYDENRNGGLDPEEIDRLVKQQGLPPTTAAQLRALDLDHSGRVEETELAPFFERLRTALPLSGAIRATDTTKSPAGLPPQWAALDLDGDGRIDVGDLANALRRIDPDLARWAPQLLRACDKNHDGTLGPDELPGPKAGQVPPGTAP